MTSLIIALDVPSAEQALALVDRIGPRADYYKVGSPLFTRSGPDVIRALKDRGKRVFLDLKYHDIPNTVAGAVQSARSLGVDMLTLHTSGGSTMMRAAAEAAGAEGPRLLGVTILTSFSATDVETVWDKNVLSLRDEVVRLAALAQESGLHGIVASPLEAETLRRRHGAGFIVVTPGIRPAGGSPGDQQRTATPLDAARAGADYLVIGRPILEAPDPVQVVVSVLGDVRAALEVVA